MPRLIILRLHPTTPVSGSDFEFYLENLVINAYDISLEFPDGRPLGQIAYEDVPPRIVQKDIAQQEPIATAVIEVPVAAQTPEYRLTDLKLEISRGTTQILTRNIYYNVDLNPDEQIPDQNNLDAFASLGPVAAYIALPPPGYGMGTGEPNLDIPIDGSAPRFSDLLAAVQAVMAADPDPQTTNLTDLTLSQCRHIAYEIVWDRQADPLPEPPRPVEVLYTPPANPDMFLDADRRRFEAEQAGYYGRLNAQAEQLTHHIYTLVSAISAEQQSQQATQVGLQFPVQPGEDVVGKINRAEVVLTNQ